MRPLAGAALVAVTLIPSASALELTDHPLVDVVVRVEDGAVVPRGDFERALRDADFVILGEKHDNSRHHVIQAELVDHIGAAGKLEAVAFEMFTTDLQVTIVEHLAEGGSVAELAEAVDWEQLGWGPWTWYGPIAHAADRHGATIVAANLAVADVREVYEGGLSALDPNFVRRTGLDQPLDDDEHARRERAMIDAHCGHDLGAAAASMVAVQRARDARLAERLATLAGDGRGVLVTGNAHADKNQGAPAVLRRLLPDANVVSLGLIEVEPDWQSPPHEVGFAFDYVWFTPRAKPTDHDYCAAFRRGG
ncbi:MAG: ChaN family lipoprotein [Pseudomonadota bacterium]